MKKLTEGTATFGIGGVEGTTDIGDVVGAVGVVGVVGVVGAVEAMVFAVMPTAGCLARGRAEEVGVGFFLRFMVPWV